MKTKIIDKDKLKEFFCNGRISNLQTDIIYICLISDLLKFQEQVKKSNSFLKIDQMPKKYNLFKSQFIDFGKIHIAEFNKCQLEESIFVDKEESTSSKKACNPRIDPILSLEQLLLTPSANNNWWIYDL